MAELMAVMQDPLELSDATADNLGAFVLAGSGAVGTAHDFFDIMLVLHVNQPGHKLQPIQRSQLLRLMAKRGMDVLPGEYVSDLSAVSEKWVLAHLADFIVEVCQQRYDWHTSIINIEFICVVHVNALPCFRSRW